MRKTCYPQEEDELDPPGLPGPVLGAAGGTLKPNAEMTGGVTTTDAAFNSGSRYSKENIRVCDVTPLISF